jgi:DNA-binding SARP family transcriptional activator
VVFRDETYFLNPEEDLWIDFVKFERRADAGRRLARAGDTQGSARELEGADALYAGDLFEDRLYEDHFRLLREHLRSVHLEVVAQVSDLQFEEARYADVIALNQRAVALDPYDEGAHRRLMEAYIAQGRRPMALRQYETCRATLSEELGLEPSEELRRLRAAI